MNSGSQNQDIIGSPESLVTCLSCFKLIDLVAITAEERRADEAWLAGEEGSHITPREFIIHLWLSLKLNKKEMPEQCLQYMFPFCNDCYVRTTFLELYAYTVRDDKAKVSRERMVRIVKRIRDTVLDSDILKKHEEKQLSNRELDIIKITNSTVLEFKKMTKMKELRIIIGEAYRKAWKLELKAEEKDISDLELANAEGNLGSLKLECLPDAPNSTQENVANISTATGTSEYIDCICRQILPSLKNRPGWSLTPQLKFKKHYMEFVHKKFCLIGQNVPE